VSRSYKIVVNYTQRQGSQELCLAATDAGLKRMLLLLDASTDVESFAVYSCLTIPVLTTMSKLTALDIGIGHPAKLEKLK
jgi:hypothetical protein